MLFRSEARTRWLEAEGYRVIRVWNNDVIKNVHGVMEMIYAAVHGATDAEPTYLKHERRRVRSPTGDHPTAARFARRPSPSRGG